jgi:hypothetical protein
VAWWQQVGKVVDAQLMRFDWIGGVAIDSSAVAARALVPDHNRSLCMSLLLAANARC